MKHLLSVIVLSFILFSCKKEIPERFNDIHSFNSIKLQLKDSLSTDDFQQLDFINTVGDKIDKAAFSFLRIPFFNKSIKSDFVLLKVETNGNFSAGKIFHIIKDEQSLSKKVLNKYNGRINIQSLERKLLTSSFITNGYVDAFHVKNNTAQSKESVVEIPLMPEVIIVCTIPGSGGGSSSDYYNLQSLFSSGGGGGDSNSPMGGSSAGGNQNSGGYYSNSGCGGGGNIPAGGTLGGSGETFINKYPLLVDFELTENLPAIDINKYLKCFSSIPDAGATCDIEIMTDIPVDKDPGKFFDWTNGSPGHTFLKFTKTNGSQIMQQNIGFYPVTGWKNILTPAPTDSKFVDNAGHEFNASLSMNLTPENFQSTLTHMLYLSHFVKYDIDDYNCTDFALEVFNYRRGSDKLTIPMFDIPGGMAPNGTATPQGLYIKLKALKESGGAGASKVTLPGYKGFAGGSNGPCN
jgi:hypothetical protein